MASMMKKAMIYLGLGPDEEYEQYEDYAASAPTRNAGSQAPSPGPADARQPGQRPPIQPQVREQPLVHPHPTISTGTVRPITANQAASASPRPGVAPRPEPEIAAQVIPEPASPERAPVVSSAVRTLGPAIAMPHAVSPTSFNDAQEIGDRFKMGQPVIVNLQAVDRDLRRRLVDFASGLCYAIAGKMERVADQVYLLTPADVEVPPEETRRHLD